MLPFLVIIGIKVGISGEWGGELNPPPAPSGVIGGGLGAVGDAARDTGDAGVGAVCDVDGEGDGGDAVSGPGASP